MTDGRLLLLLFALLSITLLVLALPYTDLWSVRVNSLISGVLCIQPDSGHARWSTK